MTAAHVASVGYFLSDETQRRTVLPNDPLHAQTPDLLFKSNDRQFGFSLLEGDCNEIVRKGRALPVSNKRVQQRKAIFSAGNSNCDPITRPQHREAAHGTAHRV